MAGAPCDDIFGWWRFASASDLIIVEQIVFLAHAVAWMALNHLPIGLAWPVGQVAASVQAHCQNCVARDCSYAGGEHARLPASSELVCTLADSSQLTVAGAFNCQEFLRRRTIIHTRHQ